MNNNLLKGIRKAVGDLCTDINKHSPEILASFGIAGFIATTILAVKATPKAIKKIETAEKDIFVNQDNTVNVLLGNGFPQLSAKEKIKLVWKDYIPSAMTCTASALCVIASVTTSKRRAAVLATAYKIVEESAKEYKEAVIKTVGEKKAQEIDEAVAQNKIDKSEPSITVINNVLDKTLMSKTIPGTTLFYEPLTNTYFYADINDFKTIAINAREEMLNGPDGYLGVCTWLCDLGINEFMPDEALASWQLTGWSAMDQGGTPNISFKATTAHKFNDIPCLCITYDKDPIPDYYYYYK